MRILEAKEYKTLRTMLETRFDVVLTKTKVPGIYNVKDRLAETNFQGEACHVIGYYEELKEIARLEKEDRKNVALSGLAYAPPMMAEALRKIRDYRAR